ncbi:UDP-N-acetylglucosamine 2-epimerase (hydrolyzing), partial [archaeon]|nr:UDP-N-acetylglucosamine 2-epimerase (hydrolyzing) [archaeon]
VNIGNRQDGRDRGRNVIDVNYSRSEILEAIVSHLNNGKMPSDPIYGSGQAGEIIANLLSEVPLTITKRLTY